MEQDIQNFLVSVGSVVTAIYTIASFIGRITKTPHISDIKNPFGKALSFMFSSTRELPKQDKWPRD